MNTKQVIVFRKDLLKGEHAIRKGKFAGQVAHASMASLLKLFTIERTNAQEGKCIPYALITDCGKTEFGGTPTVTCLGIGPYLSEELDKITGNLPLL